MSIKARELLEALQELSDIDLDRVVMLQSSNGMWWPLEGMRLCRTPGLIAVALR